MIYLKVDEDTYIEFDEERKTSRVIENIDYEIEVTQYNIQELIRMLEENRSKLIDEEGIGESLIDAVRSYNASLRVAEMEIELEQAKQRRDELIRAKTNALPVE